MLIIARTNTYKSAVVVLALSGAGAGGRGRFAGGRGWVAGGG